MEFVDTIHLNTLQIALVVALSVATIWLDRLEWVVSIYVATPLWARSIQIGPVAHTWFFLVVMVLSALVRFIKHRKFLELPKNDRWIVLWMFIWWMWMLLLIGLFSPDNEIILLRSLLLYVIIPQPFFLLIAFDGNRMKGFSVAFIITTIVGGWFSFDVLHIPLRYIITDPTLISFGVLRLNIINYHWFSYAFSISLIFIVVNFQMSRSILTRVALMICSFVCVYFLVLLGSRQSIGGLMVAMFLFLLWSIIRKDASRLRMVILVVLLVSIGVVLYQYAPQLILRSYENDISESFDFGLRRGEYWALGWRIFLVSPVWGSGFTHYIAHNLFIGTLAEQGIVGLVFLLGFFLFITKRGLSVVSDIEVNEYTMWGVAFLCVIIFGVIHSMASGSAISVWHFYWSGTILWFLESRSEQRLWLNMGDKSNNILISGSKGDSALYRKV